MEDILFLVIWLNCLFIIGGGWGVGGGGGEGENKNSVLKLALLARIGLIISAVFFRLLRKRYTS